MRVYRDVDGVGRISGARVLCAHEVPSSALTPKHTHARTNTHTVAVTYSSDKLSPVHAPVLLGTVTLDFTSVSSSKERNKMVVLGVEGDPEETTYSIDALLQCSSQGSEKAREKKSAGLISSAVLK